MAIDRLRDLLARSRNADGGWPYYAGRRSRLEPTCWAMLALGDREAARVIEGWRGPSHLLVEPAVPVVTYTFNALAALSLAAAPIGAHAVGASLAEALLAHKGLAMEDHPAIKQDSSLQGWTWSDGAFSWVEPTAWCMLAVKKLAPRAAPAAARLQEADRLMRDRACRGGGWNYGNKEVYGQHLPPHVPPTVAGVLAYQDRRDDPLVKDAVAVLTRQAPLEGSSSALALAWIALSAVGAPTGDLMSRLAARVDAAEHVGNLAALGLLLYVLERDGRREPPAAFIL
jgi:hypothetical protein